MWPHHARKGCTNAIPQSHLNFKFMFGVTVKCGIQLERQNSKSVIRYAWKVIGTIVLEAREQSPLLWWHENEQCQLWSCWIIKHTQVKVKNLNKREQRLFVLQISTSPILLYFTRLNIHIKTNTFLDATGIFFHLCLVQPLNSTSLKIITVELKAICLNRNNRLQSKIPLIHFLTMHSVSICAQDTQLSSTVLSVLRFYLKCYLQKTEWDRERDSVGLMVGE